MNIWEKMQALFSMKAVCKRQFVFPFIPRDMSICDRNRDFLKNFNISPDYHVSILSYINENIDLKGKRVLELGGSNIPREILLDDFCVKQYVGIDYINSWWPDPNHQRESVYSLEDAESVYSADDPYLIFSGSADNLPKDLFAERFDVIVSFSSIEHFSNLQIVLKEAYDVLKDDGLFFASSEPIWSSGKGHHFWIGHDYNFQVTHDFDFAHLLYNKDEFVKKYKNIRDLDKVSQQIYDWDGINRMFYSEIETDVMTSSFTHKEIYPFAIQEPSPDIKKTLCNKYSNKIKDEKDFSIRGIQFILQK